MQRQQCPLPRGTWRYLGYARGPIQRHYGAATALESSPRPAPSAPARRSMLRSRRMFPRQPEANVDMGAAVERIHSKEDVAKRAQQAISKRKQRRITNKKVVAREVMRAAPTDRTRSSHGPIVRCASVSLLAFASSTVACCCYNPRRRWSGRYLRSLPQAKPMKSKPWRQQNAGRTETFRSVRRW